MLALFWLVMAAFYFWAGARQKESVNLSATAGGQYPYLVYAKGIAGEGVTRYFGDRNRMPLYPALLATVYAQDWDTFVDRSAWFAILSSALVWAGIGCICYATLPVWPATLILLSGVVCVFLPNASFVQAELTYYGLLLATWLMLGRLIQRPQGWWAAGAGLAVALNYLTKTSGVAILAPFLVATCARAAAQWRSTKAAKSTESVPPRRSRPASWLLSGVIVTAVYLFVSFPYLANNKERFGRYFYNVNTTFFMWCDSWPEAKAFEERYDISRRYPEAPSAQIPGPVNYWRTHSAGAMLGRLGGGIRTLWTRALEGSFGRYFGISAALLVILVVRQRKEWGQLVREYWAVGLYCLLFFAGSLAAFAWYTPVAFGDRFLLSLFLPAMFGAWWLSDRLARGAKPFMFRTLRLHFSDAVAIVLSVCLIGEGAVVATTQLDDASDAFVQAYYNESRERQKEGKFEEAAQGYMGVLQLDPQFAPARHELGMIALQAGHVDGAIVELKLAVHLQPQDANMRNSLGSALTQAGRTREAISEFEWATRLDPGFAVAWYNLGGCYNLAGEIDKAEDARKRLETLDARLAAQLSALIGQ